MSSTRGRFLVLGGNPLHGSDALDSRMGACLWDLSFGQHTGDGNWGETFLGRTWMFFSGGGGGGEQELQGTTAEAFSQTTRVPNSPFMFILYIAQWKFRCSMRKDIANGGLDPWLPWADTCAVRLRQPVDLVHALKTVKGLLLLVPPRTPRSSGYDFYTDAVYVVICYMSRICICLCLVLAVSCICICLLYVVICYMSLICYMSVICLV